MNTQRSSKVVLNMLLQSMGETVRDYHPTVIRTGISLDGLIAGTACFPGGAGLWRGVSNAGPLPELFPDRPVMFVGHNFDSQRAFAIAMANKGEAGGQFWQRLISIVECAQLQLSECFFTNALMGLKPGKSTGPMPSVANYREQCSRFLAKQVHIIQPKAVVALGVNAESYVSKMPVPWTAVKHPSNWDFRLLATREDMFRQEGLKIRQFMSSIA